MRAQIVKVALHGRITVFPYDGGRIPLIDNLVSDVIVNDKSKFDQAELMRILRPLGRVCVKKNGKWTTTEKRRSDKVDDWPQYYHDAVMTDLSRDLLAGPAHGVQWLAGACFRCV